ncbi:hypothetical protein RNP40_20515, partial [Escherichia coli]|nr:hypothetical protein [Escherichia coli]
MSELKIAVSRSCPDCFSTHRECVNIDKSNYIDVAAIILSVNDVEHGKLGNDSNLLIVFYVQIMPDDFVMQLHR